MAQKIGLVAVKILGTLVGLMGFWLLWFVPSMWPDEADEHALFLKGATFFGILFAFYFFYVAYLAWFRYSPLAVRHIVAIVSLYLWSMIPKAEDRAPMSSLIFLGSFIAMYMVYRLANHYLNRLLFPIPRQA